MENMEMEDTEMGAEGASSAPSFSSSPSSSSSSSDDQAKQAFALLQPLCSRLLELPARAKGSSAEEVSLLFESLLQALDDAPVLGLRICMEYVLFPLQLLLDASVCSRSDLSSRSSTSGLPELQISDKIAENVLLCLEKILQRCPLSSASQMSLLLRKLTAAAMLSPDEASEEFRHGALRCLQQMITGLSPCNNSLCSCKDNSLPQHIVLANGYLSADLASVVNPPSKKIRKSVVKEPVEKTEDCLIELLRSKSMSAAVGHLLSLFLQISEVEAQRGSYGSAKLRIDALTTLRTLMLKVRTADALAFFLPGVSSRLVTTMQGSKKLKRQAEVSEVSYPSGAAGSSGAVEQAVRALSELLVLVLADERNLEGLAAQSQIRQSQMSMQEPGAAEEALATLSEISSRRRNTEANQFVEQTEMEPKLLPEDSIDNKSAESSIGGDMAQNNIFCVTRNAKWLEYTVKQINTLLSLSFPALCRHSVPSLRLAVIHGATMLIITCGHTLEGSKSTLLECLLAMACDEWPSVALAAHLSLTFLVIQSKELKCNLKSNICRLMERLPKVVYSGNESALIFFCRQLVAAMFFAGPEGVSDCLFQSLVATRQFLMVMAQCFSFNSVVTSSFKQMSLRQGSLGYIPGIYELNAEKLHEKETDDLFKKDAHPSDRDLALSQEQPKKDIFNKNNQSIQLPQMPPWLRTGGRRVYKELSRIVRLAGLSSIYGDDDCRHLFRIIEELLDPLRQISSLTQKELYMDEVGQSSDYVGHGNWQRAAATAVSLLTEVFYGASGQWVHTDFLLFEGLDSSKTRKQSGMPCPEDQEKLPATLWDDWKKLAQKDISRTLCELVGDILHDYMLSEVWNLPPEGIADLWDRNSHYLSSQAHILRDNATLQQVILEGVGVLAQCLGKYFEEQGFLGSVLFILLEQLGSSHYEISSSADLAVHVISTACGYPSVKALISASTDYIVDSLCRELRHLDLYPSAPNMLVAALRYTGACQDLLPLLQEPMRIISLELEIPSRQRNSQNIVPMLRALKEIIHAAKGEGQIMQNLIFSGDPSFPTSEKGDEARKDAMEYELPGDCTDFKNEHEQFVTRLKESQRSRQTVEDITIMCLKACAPLMASRDQHVCLLSLEIIKVGFEALSSMDDARKNERKQIERISRLLAHQDELTSLDDMEAAKLLPTMHQVWPHIAACLKHTTPSVLVQSLKVIASVTSSCGGEFFSRRLQKDAVPKMLTLLCRGTALQSKSKGGQHALDNRKLLVHLQGNNLNAPNEFASASLHKVQEAVLDCITEIARSQRASPALQGALEQIAAVTVGIACAVPSLQESAVQALIALSSVDADLIWILIADVAHGSNLKLKKETSPGPGFPEVSKLLPPVKSGQEALWKQMSGNCNFSTDSSMAWGILSRIESCR